MRPSRLLAVAAITIAVLVLGLVALFSTGSGTPQTTTANTVWVGISGGKNVGSELILGPAEITIPNVKGESETQAAQAFFSLGFQVVNAANIAEPGETPGTVLDQFPAAGTKVDVNQTSVRLTVAASAPGGVRIVPHTKG
jgi:beta-lactam-binding protein with PASTA domain